MPNNLMDGLVEYADGNGLLLIKWPDVTTFLWAVGPELEKDTKLC